MVASHLLLLFLFARSPSLTYFPSALDLLRAEDCIEQIGTDVRYALQLLDRVFVHPRRLIGECQTAECEDEAMADAVEQQVRLVRGESI